MYTLLYILLGNFIEPTNYNKELNAVQLSNTLLKKTLHCSSYNHTKILQFLINKPSTCQVRQGTGNVRYKSKNSQSNNISTTRVWLMQCFAN